MSTGHFVCYEPKKFREEALDTLATANKIIEEYEGKGMPLTLRQLYYQLVAHDLFPDDRRYSLVGGKWVRDELNGTKNAEPNYSWLGSLINEGRMAGLVSWTAIEDRGRNLMGLRTQTSPEGAVRSLLPSYRIDKWADQEWRPEVWVEKAALEGVIGSICNELQVNFFACRGYNSQSEQWRAGRRLAGYISRGQRPIIFHLGDHDPSGIDMTRDNRDRLSLFAGVPILVQRLALNMPQIEQYRPPPNPAKMTDSRFQEYSSKYGDESWELDALEPTVIRSLIEEAIMKIRDPAKWDAMLKIEAEDKMHLESMIEESDHGDDE